MENNVAESNVSGNGKLLSGRRALVTGGGAGLGKIFADALAEAGADLVISSRRGEVLENSAVELRRHGGRVDCIAADVSRPEEVARLKEAAGAVDILVNNAGYSIRKDSWLEITPAEWLEVLGVNLHAPFMMAQAFIPGMMERGWGRVINLSSIYGVVTSNPGHYPDMKSDNCSYSVSKHGLLGLTKHLAVRVAGSGVTVNALSPGIFAGQSTQKRADGVIPGALTAQRLREAIPVGRTGKDEDLRDLIVFLAGPNSSYVTGQNISVDGGFTLW